jgi:hypothetical protein
VRLHCLLATLCAGADGRMLALSVSKYALRRAVALLKCALRLSTDTGSPAGQQPCARLHAKCGQTLLLHTATSSMAAG